MRELQISNDINYCNFLHRLMCILHIRDTLKKISCSENLNQDLASIITEAFEVVPEYDYRARHKCVQFVMTHREMLEFHVSTSSAALSSASQIVDSLLAEVCALHL
jgi:hypothetical protein